MTKTRNTTLQTTMLRFEPLKLEQPISRHCVMLFSYGFTNHSEHDVHIEFVDHPEVEETDYDGTLVYVPAGSTVRYEKCHSQIWPSGLHVRQSDEYGGRGGRALPIEAQFEFVELPNSLSLKAPLKAGRVSNVAKPANRN